MKCDYCFVQTLYLRRLHCCGCDLQMRSATIPWRSPGTTCWYASCTTYVMVATWVEILTCRHWRRWRKHLMLSLRSILSAPTLLRNWQTPLLSWSNSRLCFLLYFMFLQLSTFLKELFLKETTMKGFLTVCEIKGKYVKLSAFCSF